MYLAFQQSHGPSQVAPEFSATAKKHFCNFDSPRECRLQETRQVFLGSKQAQCIALHLNSVGQVHSLDHSVGHLIQELKNHKVFDNTLIIFLSDASDQLLLLLIPLITTEWRSL